MYNGQEELDNVIQFPEEQTPQEAATAKYVRKRTCIPVAQRFFHCQDPKLGPFIILPHIENQGIMSARVAMPNDDPNVVHVLEPNTLEATLDGLWGKAARCLLQLSRLAFPRIGGLVEDDRPGSYVVAGRPITHNMTDMVRLANIPRAVLPPQRKMYSSVGEWYFVLDPPWWLLLDLPETWAAELEDWTQTYEARLET
ncbi:hypothetical protein N0V88_001699 [Collariella sp. IMI 366227]|nr:hypothetical protein N0V88_001699 [Collariella sp. IMI 366227]